MGLILWVILGGIVGGMIGERKGRGGAGIALGVLLGPIGWLIIWLGPDYKQARDTKKCPFCAELIKKEATVCRYCGRDLPPVEAATVAAAPAPRTSPLSPGSKAFVFLAIGILALVVVLSLFLNHKPELEKATLTMTVYPQDGSSALPAGTTVEVISHSDATARIRYSGRELVVSMAALKQSK